MKESKKVRLLLLMVLMLSAICSACMGVVAYQLATGELPFEIDKHYKFREDVPMKKEEEFISAEVPLKDNKIDEATVRKEYKLFYEQRMMLKQKEKDLEETKRLIDASVETSRLLEKNIKAEITKLEKAKEDQKKDFDMQMSKLDMKEKAIEESKKVLDKGISQNISNTLASMKPVTAMVLLSDLDVKLSARLLNLMQQQRRSDILSQMIEATKIDGYPDPLPISTKVQLRKKANEIIVELRKLKEDRNADSRDSVLTPTPGNP